VDKPDLVDCRNLSGVRSVERGAVSVSHRTSTLLPFLGLQLRLSPPDLALLRVWRLPAPLSIFRRCLLMDPISPRRLGWHATAILLSSSDAALRVQSVSGGGGHWGVGVLSRRDQARSDWPLSQRGSLGPAAYSPNLDRAGDLEPAPLPQLRLPLCSQQRGRGLYDATPSGGSYYPRRRGNLNLYRPRERLAAVASLDDPASMDGS